MRKELCQVIHTPLVGWVYFYYFFLIYFLFYIGELLIYNVVLVSGVEQSGSVMRF